MVKPSNGDLLIKNLRTVVTCDGADSVFENSDILIKGGVIAAIGPNLSAGEAQLLDGRHMLCYPGLINTHHHLYQYFSRNLPEVQGFELFDWLRALYEIWKNIDGETVRLAATCAMGELVKHGCTTCFDHHYVFPAGAGDLVGEEFAAAKALGIRLHASRGSMDLSKKDGGLPPDCVVQSIDAIMRDSAFLIEKYHDPSPGSMGQMVLAPCSPFSVSGELLSESAALARQYGVRLHTHLCETADEEKYILARFGLRPFDYMERLGWVADDVWYAHGIHFNDSELERLAQSGAGVAHCPVSNMKLSSGVMRLPEMLRLGVTVGLGVDGSASNDSSNLLEEMRVCYLLHRLTSGDAAPTGYDILKLATRGGAALLGRSDIGSLETGKCGDLFLIDTRRTELAAACLDPMNLLGTVGIKGYADYTVVGGRIVAEHGYLEGVDGEKLSRDANAAAMKYLGRI